MTTTAAMTTEQIITILQAAEEDGINGMSPVFGIRRIPAADSVAVGQLLFPSQQWDDDIPTGVMLNGVCAIGIEIDADSIESALESINSYHDGQIFIVAGIAADKGFDAGEVIIREARVLAIL